MVNKKRLIKLTRQLIGINSENPGGDESAIAVFVARYLKALGLETRIYAFRKDRCNLLAVLAGTNRKHSLLLTPHLDTVPQGKSWKRNPFLAKVEGGRIYGLGATDCKGNLACAIEAISSIREGGLKLNYEIILAATADEESGSVLGLAPLLDRGILKPDAALVLDADDFNIIVAQKGLLHLKVKIEGRRAHGAYPWLGKNAIDISIAILRELKKKRQAYPKSPHLRGPTLNIGTIKGGDKVNVVADWCEFELDFRFLPGQSAKVILNSLRSIIRRHTARFKVEVEGIQEPYKIEEGSVLLKCLAQAMRKIGVKPVISGSEGATTISFFQKKNIPALATGFGCARCAHMADEYAKADNLYKGARVLEEFLKNLKFNPNN